MKAKHNTGKKQSSVHSDDEHSKTINIIELKFRRVFGICGFHSVDALFILNQNKTTRLN
ncbi:MAG: hypothetical protein ABI723_07455 [Bacteroidia bacterium]